MKEKLNFYHLLLYLSEKPEIAKEFWSSVARQYKGPMVISIEFIQKIASESLPFVGSPVGVGKGAVEETKERFVKTVAEKLYEYPELAEVLVRKAKEELPKIVERFIEEERRKKEEEERKRRIVEERKRMLMEKLRGMV